MATFHGQFLQHFDSAMGLNEISGGEGEYGLFPTDFAMCAGFMDFKWRWRRPGATEKNEKG